MSDKKRINYIDVIKGIAILLVVLGHSISTMEQPVNKVILSFHMPLFFFSSGLVTSYSTKRTFISFLGKKLRSLMVPKITLAVLNILVGILIECVLTKRVTVGEFDYLSPFLAWFLFALFGMEIVLWIIRKLESLFKYNKCIFRVVVLICLLGLFTGLNIEHIKIVQQVIGASFFGTLGYFSKDIVEGYTKSKYVGVSIFLIPILICGALNNVSIGMYINQYGNLFCFFLTAIVGIVVVIDIAGVIKSNKIIEFFGSNTIVVYVTHFAVIRILKGGVNYVLETSTLEMAVDKLFLVFLATILLEVPIIFICNRFFPVLFGKEKYKS